MPGNGVYAAYAILDDGRSFPAAVSVGINPTTDQDGLKKVEAYLMGDFAEDLYGSSLGLDFRFKIRDEARFESLPALIAQIEQDVADIRTALS